MTKQKRGMEGALKWILIVVVIIAVGIGIYILTKGSSASSIVSGGNALPSPPALPA